jgi:hypothetical protein
LEDHLEVLSLYWRIILKWISNKPAERVWTGFVWLRLGTSRGLLYKRHWKFEFRKMQGISSLAEDLLDSKKDSAQCI